MNTLKEGEDYYFNEEGLMVLTKKFHLQKGFCCGNGCKHCPYDFKNVTEPLRTELLKKRAVNNDGCFLSFKHEKKAFGRNP
ncbi:MAG TPA: DUF5522 domain-containing protein [Ferruginibacter sp.]|nr:DUF5522 domain-containing protein [Ferruginibacter sp.]HRE63446.1 DUF5522 domain-containing protein [Ferruginibacter sp.]